MGDNADEVTTEVNIGKVLERKEAATTARLEADTQLVGRVINAALVRDETSKP